MKKDKGSANLSRRSFLRHSSLAAGAVIAGTAPAVEAQASQPAMRPNVLMICADQFRQDFIGAHGENPSTITPNLNAMVHRGTTFRKCMSNNPLCAPSRSSFITSRYPTETGVWKLGPEPVHTFPTLATEFRKAGYTTAFMGKWHTSGDKDASGKKQLGWIPPGPSRGGFDDVWEGANITEVVSHPNHGSYWDNAGTDIGFKDEYRVDFTAGRALKFLEQKHDKPWLLYVSQLEPHHQNDIDQFVAPDRYRKDFGDSFVPPDLIGMPGNWRSHLQGYYGCVRAIDDCVGTLVETLKKTGQLDNTVILFFSDHGCTFRTRMGEYKRSPHDASIRVPFIVCGPGFDNAQVVDEVVTLLDLTPTLLDAAGLSVPSGMRGHSLKPLANDGKARAAWDSVAYIQISASMTGRAIRTKNWSYCVYDPTTNGNAKPASNVYEEFCLYSIASDPEQHVNLIGRPEYADVQDMMRAEMKRRIAMAGEGNVTINPAKFYV